MTEIQHQVLKLMDERNVGAISLDGVFGEWAFCEDIRQDEKKAELVLNTILNKGD